MTAPAGLQHELKLEAPPGYRDGGRTPAAAPPGLALAWFTARGLHAGDRPENQDNLVLVDATGASTRLRDEAVVRDKHPDWPIGRMRLAVLDGMGGHEGGRMVAETVAEAVAALPAYRQRRSLVAALDRLHARLHAELGGGLRPPGSTLTLLEVIDDTQAWLYHVGDSRLYALDAQGHAQCLTVDHVPATRAALDGALDERGWQRHVHAENGSVISQAFVLGGGLHGQGPALLPELTHLRDAELPEFLRGRADCRTLRLQPGMRYLLASDGLWCVPEPLTLVESAWPPALRAAATPAAALDGLLKALYAAATPRMADNTTAILLQVAQGATTNGGTADNDEGSAGSR